MRNHQSRSKSFLYSETDPVLKTLVMGSWLSREPQKMTQMKKTKQNLILFFEENEDIKDISSNLVRFYMNRSVIDEEDQTEISDVYLLSKRDENAQIIEFYRENGKFHQLYRTGKDLGNMQKSMDKLEKDKTTFELSVSKIIESEMARLRDLKQNWFREWIGEVDWEWWTGELVPNARSKEKEIIYKMYVLLSTGFQNA